MKKKSILLIMPYGSVGGMERLALNFYTKYKSMGYDVKGLKFIKLENDIINFGEDELFLKPYDFHTMSKIERMLFYFKAPYLINKIIKKYNITHSIAFGDMANLFSSLSFSKEYKIGSIHALKSVEFAHKTAFHRLTKFGYRSSYKKLNKLVCISKGIKKDLIENCNYKFNNIKVIYNPHNIEEIISLSKQPIDDIKEKEMFSKKTILFLGRLSVQKAPWHFIKAFKLLRDKHIDANLIIIGDGDFGVSEYIKNQISEYNISNCVFFLGRKSNPYKYLSRADALVLSSYYEGTPNVIVESIALEVPIVSTNCTTGIMELMSLANHLESSENITVESGIISPNLFKGRLEIPTDYEFIREEELLSEALEKILISNEYKNNLMKNKDNLLDKFDLNRVVHEYLK